MPIGIPSAQKKGRFIRTKEDFTCGHCGREVRGTGYTNHCPNCLWSRHVDVNPGDRASRCRGMMEPISVDVEKDSYVITHRCIVCGYIKKNVAAPEDSFDEIAKLIRTFPKPKKQ
jgi:rubrerythrin